jgi:hypothetical protein
LLNIFFLLVPELSKDAGYCKPEIGKFNLQFYVGRALEKMDENEYDDVIRSKRISPRWRGDWKFLSANLEKG